MPIATLLRYGTQVPYTPGADVAVGDVIDCGAFALIALRAISANTLGDLTGWDSPTFVINKFSGEAISFGDKIYWDAGTLTATKTVGYSEAFLGYCVAAALSGDTTVTVKLAPPGE